MISSCVTFCPTLERNNSRIRCLALLPLADLAIAILLRDEISDIHTVHQRETPKKAVGNRFLTALYLGEMGGTDANRILILEDNFEEATRLFQGQAFGFSATSESCPTDVARCDKLSIDLL